MKKTVIILFMLFCFAKLSVGGIVPWGLWQVTADAGDEDQKGHWKCNDDAASTTVIDDSGEGNNGILAGGDNTADISQDPGKINKSLLLNGVDDYLNLDVAISDISSATKGAIAFWIKPTNASTDNIVPFSFGDTDADEYLYYKHASANGKMQVYCRIGGVASWTFLTDNVILTSGTWTHMILKHDGIAPLLYIDGASVPITFTDSTDKTAWFSALTGVDNIRVGCRNYNNRGVENFYAGEFDDIRIFIRDLTASDISNLYNSGSGTEDDID